MARISLARNRRSSAPTILFLLAALLALDIHSSFAGRGDCGQPLTSGTNPVATDARRVLTTGVGSTQCSLIGDPAAEGLPFDGCICDVNSSGAVNSTDALLTLQKGVGQSVTLNCPCVAVPPLTFSLDVNPDPVRPGESMNVLVSLSNTSNNPIADLRVDVHLPSQIGLFLTSTTRGAPAVCIGDSNQAACSPGERLQWTVGTLAPGAGTTLVMPAPIPSGAANGTQIDINADALIGATIHIMASHTVFVQSGRVLDLALSENTDPIEPGNEITYRLDFGNRTTSTLAQNTTLTMPVPEGLSLVGASDGGVLNGTSDAVVWSLGNLSPGQNGSREAVFTVDAAARNGSIIQAEAHIADGGTQQTNARTDTRVRADSPLLLTVELNADPAMPAESLEVLMTVTNRGPVQLSAVEVEAFLPLATNSFFVTTTTSGAPASCLGDSNTAACSPREQVVFNVGPLAAGAGKVLRMPPAILSTAASGSVVSYDARARDADRNNAGVRKAVRVETTRVIDLAIDDDIDPLRAGDSIPLRIGYGNRTTSTLAQSVSLVVPVPANTTFVSAADGGVFDSGANTVTWDLGTVAPGQHGKRSLVVAVDAGLRDGEVIRSQAFTTDSSGRRGRAEAHSRVQSDVALLLTMEVNPDPALTSETVDTIFTVTNIGPVQLSNVEVELLIPAELNSFFVTSQTRGAAAACRGDSNAAACSPLERLVFDVGTLPAGAGLDLSAPPAILSSAPAGTQVTYNARARDADGNDVGTRASVRVAPRVLDLAISESIDPVEPGRDIAYRLSFGNRSNSTIVQNTTLVMPIPAGTTFVSAGDGGLFDAGSNSVTWTLGTLTNGQIGIRELVVSADAGLADGAIVRAEAQIGDSAGIRSRATTETRVQTGLPLHIALGMNPDPVVPGKTIDGVLTVTNTGGIPLFDVEAEVFLPDDLASFFVTAAVGGPSPACLGDSNTAACSVRENLTWSIGTLAAGAAVTLTMPPAANSAAPPGTVMTFNARVRDSGGNEAGARAAVRVEATRLLDLAIDDSIDPVAAGAQLTYTLRYGNRSTATTEQNIALVMPIPDGASFSSATGGGVFDAGTGEVTWTIGTLVAGTHGVRQLVVDVDSGALPCTVLQANARISGALARRTRATVETRVDEGLPLQITLTLLPDPVSVGSPVTGTLRVTNTGSVQLFNVAAEVVLPDDISVFLTSTTSGASAACRGDSNAAACSPHERLVFTVGTLDPATTATMIFSPTFPAGTVSGRVFTMNAKALEAGGVEVPARASVRTTIP